MPVIQFKGKTFVQNHHLAVPYHQLVPVKDKGLSAAPSLNDNLIIQGDNLLALKALLPTYAGKIKCIYIDPPYNTGNQEWVYSDKVNAPIIKEWIGKVVGKEGEDLTRHDKWLCMMMPRLKLLRELMSDKGVILISIDDVEVGSLRLLMDEIFGAANYLGTVVWKKKTNGNNVGDLPPVHDYIVAYSKTVGSEPILGFPMTDEEIAMAYSNPDNDPNGPWTTMDLSANHKGPHFPITNPKTGKQYLPADGRYWVFNEEEVKKRIADGRIIFGKSGNAGPIQKSYLKDKTARRKAESWWDKHGLNADGTIELTEIFGKAKVFDHSKPSTLIKHLINITTENSDIVLDSFAGSGTTAQAVLELNKVDGGNRKFILVEMEDYANDITAERVRRVIKGVPSSKNELVKQGLSGGFSYFELGDAIETASLLSGTKLPTYKELARYIYFTATGEEFNDSSIDEAKNYLGKSSQYDVYMYYRPDIEYLKTTALTLDEARKLRAENGDKSLLVFAPTKYVEQTELDSLKITFCQLPFEIYKVK